MPRRKLARALDSPAPDAVVCEHGAGKNDQDRSLRQRGTGNRAMCGACALNAITEIYLGDARNVSASLTPAPLIKSAAWMNFTGSFWRNSASASPHA